MKASILALLTLSTVGISQSVNAEMTAECGAVAPPLLSVADFNGDGIVTLKDLYRMFDRLRSGRYHALYDRDGNGRLNKQDFMLAINDYFADSSASDRQMAQLYNRFSHFQHVSGHDEVLAMGYQPFGGALQGHGQHWLTHNGQFAVSGFREANSEAAEGLNITADGSDIPALFWGEAATPLFHDSTSATGLSTLDWPSPNGVWNTQRVQAFADAPPDFFPETNEDQWHMHAGLCVTLEDRGNGPQWQINQHMSNAECQALPNLQPLVLNGVETNPWGNFWMLHVWAFHLNPNGTFANTHPCVDPQAPSESVINGDRVVPPFFQHHG